MRPALSRVARSSLAVATLVVLLGMMAPAAAAATSAQSPLGVTVSWPPTATPVRAHPGVSTSSVFWVTNPTAHAVPITISPAYVTPGNDGHLAVHAGRDPQASTISYSPSRFTVLPHHTVSVRITAVLRGDLGPGVYLLSALVHPHHPPGPGNIQTSESIAALATFQVPGATDARATVHFVDPPALSGVAAPRRFGTLEIELASTGRTVLEVLDDSTSALYAYTETSAAQAPTGNVVFAGHTKGEPNDVRTKPALYFPGHYRDFPLAWHAAPLALGLATIHGFVSYQPGPGRLVSASAVTRVLLVSPWWGLLPWIVALTAGALVTRRIRRRRQDTVRGQVSPTRRGGRAVASLGIVLLLGAPALLSRPLALAACCAPAVVLALLVPLLGHGRAAPLRLARAGQVIASALLLAGAAGVVLGALERLPADLGFAAVTGAGATVLVTWWASWVIRPQSHPRHLRGRQKAPEGAGVGA